MKASIQILHDQDSDWLRELAFYKDELVILNNRLGETASKNTSKDLLAMVEHFQNKFILLNEQLDILNHDIHIRETQVGHMALDNPEQIDEKFSTVRDTVFSRMKGFAQSIRETRFEFNRFLSKNM